MTQKAVAYAREKGKMITFDPNLRPPLWKSREEAREQILWGLSRADVVKISDDEVEFLWGITDETEAAGKLLNEYGVRLAMITLGPKGAYLANRNGGAAIAAFASTAASLSTQVTGGIPSIPSEEAVLMHLCTGNA